MPLPFFHSFIRERGFLKWRAGLVGTKEERDLHPFTWTFDEETETVHKVNRWVRQEDGQVEEDDTTVTVSEALSERLHAEVETAMREIRATVAQSQEEAGTVLRAFRAEVESLKATLLREPEMARYSELWSALDVIGKGLEDLETRRGGKGGSASSAKGLGVDKRAHKVHLKPRVVALARLIAAENPEIGKTEMLEEIKNRLMEEGVDVDDIPSERQMGRYLEKGS